MHRIAPSGATALLTAVHAGHGGDQVTHAAALGLGLVATAQGWRCHRTEWQCPPLGLQVGTALGVA
jgi:hypothetical protein